MSKLEQIQREIAELGCTTFIISACNGATFLRTTDSC